MLLCYLTVVTEPVVQITQIVIMTFVLKHRVLDASVSSVVFLPSLWSLLLEGTM